jgi:predicted nuclease of predicted toxin-antitoxin system
MSASEGGLFDQNLSIRHVGMLSDCYPGSEHVQDARLGNADDAVVWAYAAEHSMTIVSKDSDFHQRSLVDGPPPMVVWLQVGNCTTCDIERILRRHLHDIALLERDPAAAFPIID